MGLGTDIETGLPMSLSMNVYAKYQWQNYGAANENEWDGYRFKVKYFVPITQLWGGNLSYIGFTNFDWGSDTGDNDFRDLNGRKARTNDSIASSHIPALNYDHWHYSVVARYWHNGGQWNDDASLNFGNGDFSVRSTGWGGYRSWVTTSNQCGIVRAGALTPSLSHGRGRKHKNGNIVAVLLYLATRLLLLHLAQKSASDLSALSLKCLSVSVICKHRSRRKQR